MREPRLRGVQNLNRSDALSRDRHQNGGTQDSREQREDPICPDRPEDMAVDHGIYLREVTVLFPETRSHRRKIP